ncbi:DUF2512 family protein [Alkalihalobacterium elongatum]|uniref:DUF2512 family protein n=1 Tax=Alkalihalobacterium elongatum TaxID=2675466 RepID=UPI001C1F9031|nr:DUF2512 family protein [Alkalihalobacterium elongatum]
MVIIFKHLNPILIKMAMTIIVLLIVMSVAYNYPVWTPIGIGILVAAVSYSVGDLYILKISNNVVASLADLFMATWLIWIIGPLFQGLRIPFIVAFISALLITGGEWFFHKYMVNYRKNIHHNPKYPN